jgi:hypothetical protein
MTGQVLREDVFHPFAAYTEIDSRRAVWHRGTEAAKARCTTSTDRGSILSALNSRSHENSAEYRLLIMDDHTNDSVSRRRFLQSLSLAGLMGLSGSVLAACGGGGDSGGSADDAGADAGADASATTAQADCSDLSGLTDAQKQQRTQMAQQLQYVEESPEAEKNCANCALYKQPEGGSECGGCQLFPGPVYPEGYCTSWAPAA